MRLLTFLARRFAWQPFARNLPPATVTEPTGATEGPTAVAPELSVEPLPAPGAMDQSLVAFIHCEPRDVPPEARDRAFRHALKHLKWHAGKGGTRAVVLHSFAHLGNEAAPPDFADALLNQLAARLSTTGFTVVCTPFGHTHAWTLEVLGEGHAKIWKEI